MWFDKAKELINKTEGDVGLLVKNLATGEVFAHCEDERFPSASTIKVPILLTLLDAAAEGRVELKTVSTVEPANVVGGSGIVQYLSDRVPFTLLDHATMMIDLSDNTSTNQIIARVGMDTVNAKCRELGLKETVLGRMMMDFEARKQGKDNFTCCRDMLVMFEIIYKNPDKYTLALKLLKQQLFNSLLSLLTNTEELEFAHKTGGLEGVRHDVGIMYLDAPIFIALLTKNLKREPDGIRLANEIGLLIYNEYKK